MFHLVQLHRALLECDGAERKLMRTSVTLNDETLQELLEVTETTNMTQAVSTAVNEYLRRRRLERFRALKGRIDIISNEEIEAAELGELEPDG